MAIKTISQFDAATPASNDKILFEQNGEGKSTTIGNAVNTCSLTYEEIMASTDLSGKVASADALKKISNKIGFGDSGFIRIRNLVEAASYIDIFDSRGNGLILSVGPSGIGCYKQINGVQTEVFVGH